MPRDAATAQAPQPRRRAEAAPPALRRKSLLLAPTPSASQRRSFSCARCASIASSMRRAASAAQPARQRSIAAHRLQPPLCNLSAGVSRAAGECRFEAAAGARARGARGRHRAAAGAAARAQHHCMMRCLADPRGVSAGAGAARGDRPGRCRRCCRGGGARERHGVATGGGAFAPGAAAHRDARGGTRGGGSGARCTPARGADLQRQPVSSVNACAAQRPFLLRTERPAQRPPRQRGCRRSASRPCGAERGNSADGSVAEALSAHVK